MSRSATGEAIHIYTMLITNNHDLFHLWWKENYVKHKKNSKCYDQDCLKNFILHFKVFIKSSNFQKQSFCGWNLLYLSKNMSYIKIQRLWIPNVDVSEKIRKINIKYQIKQTFSLHCKLLTLILDLNYVKGLRITKIAKQSKFEGTWGKLEVKYCFQRQSWLKYELNFNVSVK